MTTFDSKTSKPAKKPTGKGGGRIARLLANPGTRAALADKYLSPAQLKQRQLNQRLNAPVTPGSSLTNRELAHQADNATQVAYGADEQALNAKQTAANDFRDRVLPGWYDDYQKQLQAAQAQITNNNVNANQAFQGLQNAAGKTSTGVEGTGEQGDASAAQGIRSQMLGNWAALQNQTGQATQNYATGLAGIVAPGQKLTALGDANRQSGLITDKIAALLKDKGAANQKYRSDTIADEQKNVLATSIATGKQLATDERLKQSSPSGKAAAAAATSEATTAAKYGRTVHQWRLLGPDGRTAAMKASKSKPADTVYTSGPFAGRKKSDVEAMSDGGRQTLVDRYDQKSGAKSKKAAGGPDWLTQGEMGTGLAQLGPLKGFAIKAKNGQSFVAGHKPQPPMSRAEALQKITENVAAPKDPVLLSAALDAAYLTYLSAGTVKRLIAAGYKPSRVAQTLGVRTAAGRAKAAAPAQNSSSERAPGGT